MTGVILPYSVSRKCLEKIRNQIIYHHGWRDGWRTESPELFKEIMDSVYKNYKSGDLKSTYSPADQYLKDRLAQGNGFLKDFSSGADNSFRYAEVRSGLSLVFYICPSVNCLICKPICNKNISFYDLNFT